MGSRLRRGLNDICTKHFLVDMLGFPAIPFWIYSLRVKNWRGVVVFLPFTSDIPTVSRRDFSFSQSHVLETGVEGVGYLLISGFLCTKWDWGQGGCKKDGAGLLEIEDFVCIYYLL